MSSEPKQLNYPPELPVTAHRAEILEALAANQTVVVCGDTGSGKTTQLPKMALEHLFRGRGAFALDPRDLGRVAVTQPRRLAAVTMAERVAAELGEPVGGLVGYQHRYARKVSDRTRVKFLTDGVLLAETRADSLLRAYDVIIVDEAHERSLNVDFLLGILTRILVRRPELRVVVSSATLDVRGFSEFFFGAPVISVPGRLFPIDLVYRPPVGDEEGDLAGDVADAVASLPPEGDILVFLPGERDIRETAERLEGRERACEIIPLLASLPASEQQRAFRLSSRRRIILATNVAETSVTIPGIRCVIDSGLARLSRYVHRTQVQRLQIEPVSQASARQRAGRCGRLGPGTCVRLYSEEDYLSREAYTPPEILRSSLAGVILTMLDLRLGDVARFPFIDAPKPSMIKEGLAELEELGAIETDRFGVPSLTPIGRRLARIPVEPRLARMLLAASDLATLPSVLPVVAGLSCEDPRRRPVEEREKAREAHAHFRVAGSDFLGTLKLWRWYASEGESGSQTKLRRLCKTNYLSYPKMREWRDLVRQLTELANRLGLDTEHDNGGEDAFHRAILTGLLGRIGHFDTESRDYRGSHAVRFALHPASALAKKPPEWVMAGSLVDTARLFARDAAAIDVKWIESAARKLMKRSYRAPEWDAATGYVRALEQSVLYGLVIVPSRRCDYSRVDPVFSRELFIRFGLVEGAFPKPPPQVRANSALISELRRRAEKLRRPELFDEGALERFFDRVVPADICSADALRKWLHAADAKTREAFALRRSDWIRGDEASGDAFPERIVIGGAKLALAYRHDRDGGEEDGITCTVLKSDAAALRLWRHDWLVPGALPAKLMWMLSSLPSALRRVLMPFDETMPRLLARLKPGSEPLIDAVRQAVAAEWGFRIPEGAWDESAMPPHLRVRFRLKDDATGRILAVSRDCEEIYAAAGLASEKRSVRTDDGVRHRTWDFGPLAESVGDSRAGWKLEHFPALHDEGDGVTIRLYADRATAERAHSAGVTRLFVLALGQKARCVLRKLPFDAALHLKAIRYDEATVGEDVLEGSVRDALVSGRPPVRDEAEFVRRLESGLPEVLRLESERLSIVRDSLVAAAEITEATDDPRCPQETAASVRNQLAWLVYRGFPRTVPIARLRHYARYLKGMRIRLERARVSPSSDRAKEERVSPHWERYRALVTGADRAKVDAAVLSDYRWLVEEYRVSVFAQELRTSEPASPKRLDALWDSLG